MRDVVRVEPGAYRDSVTLMQVSARLAASDGVDTALVAMATDLNLALLAELGFDAPAGAGPSDLVVAVRAEDPEAAHASAAALLAERDRPQERADREPARSIRTAAGQDGGASIALISVPGPHAFVEAMEALRAGLHAIVFSDNVSVAHEIALKTEAEHLGLFALGPDCGTVILGGVGFGFANVCLPGPVGLVAASGTGAQQICTLLDAAGVGVRHVIGVGGRDLTREVGGAATRRALVELDADPQVERIGLVSKSFEAPLDDLLPTLSTPVELIGSTELTEGADRLAGGLPELPARAGRLGVRTSGLVHGLYSGGTLAAEAAAVLATTGRVLDLGADELTVGRPHPMIDPTIRLKRIEESIADPDCAGILLDVVLGHGAHPDPAGSLAPAIGDAVAAGLTVTAAVIGTRHDPQGLDRQIDTLTGLDAWVYVSNAQAAEHARDHVL